MEHSRKNKLLMIIALVFGIASLSVGFAAFSVSLNISSNASVTPSSDTFSVKFSINKNSFVVGTVVPSSNSYNLTSTNGTIDNSSNPTIKGLSATFTSPGQYVEYTIYARNEGEYTAYLNNINYLGDKTCTGDTGTTDSLVQSACESINIKVTIGSTTYTETTPITGHPLNKKTGEQIKVRLEYASNGAYVDGTFSIAFPDIALVYSTLDDSSLQPAMPKIVELVSGNLNDPGSIVAIGDEQFYIFGIEGENIKLLSMMNITLDDNPIQSSNAGCTEFSSSSQQGENKSDYDGSIVQGYVNNYTSYLEGLGANIVDVRLITKEELESLGCISKVTQSTCKNAPEWVYATSYWTGTASGTGAVYLVENPFFGDSTVNDMTVGVRPVVIISASEF